MRAGVSGKRCSPSPAFWNLPQRLLLQWVRNPLNIDFWAFLCSLFVSSCIHFCFLCFDENLGLCLIGIARVSKSTAGVFVRRRGLATIAVFRSRNDPIETSGHFDNAIKRSIVTRSIIEPSTQRLKKKKRSNRRDRVHLGSCSAALSTNTNWCAELPLTYANAGK